MTFAEKLIRDYEVIAQLLEAKLSPQDMADRRRAENQKVLDGLKKPKTRDESREAWKNKEPKKSSFLSLVKDTPKAKEESLEDVWNDQRISHLNSQLGKYYELEFDEQPLLHFEYDTPHKRRAEMLADMFDSVLDGPFQNSLKVFDIVAISSNGDKQAYVDITMNWEATDAAFLAEAKKIHDVLMKAVNGFGKLKEA